MSISPLKSIFKIGTQPSEVPEVVSRRKSLKKRLSSALKRLSFNRPSSNRLSSNRPLSNRLSFNQSLSKRSSNVSNWRILIEEDITKGEEGITKGEEDITKGYVRMKPVPPRIKIPMDIRVQAWIKEAEEAAKQEVYVSMDSKNLQKSEKI